MKADDWKGLWRFVVTAVAFGFGIRILWISQRLIDSGAVTDKWPIVGVLAIGTFLLVGSQYKKFKAGVGGIEAERAIVALFNRFNTLAAQSDLSAQAVAANRAQVAEIGRALSESGAISSEAIGRINAALRADPSTR
jgi:hypothetical protein